MSVSPPTQEVDVQLTSFTDYGLRALIYMASLPEGKMTSISEVTQVYGVSRNHMVKIINQLSRAGFVTAVRGKNGGIRLGRPCAHYSCGGRRTRAGTAFPGEL